MQRRRVIYKYLVAFFGVFAAPGLTGFAKRNKLGPEALPKVLILGDSISIGYFPYVKVFLQNKADVTRPFKSDGIPENCQGTTNGIMNVERWIGHEKWDVIHFNFGLHDLKHVNPVTGKNSQNPADPRQAEPKQYKKLLRQITEILKKTGAKLIFATTTPYPEQVNGPCRTFGDEKVYNEIAVRIMKKFNVPINDLHAFILPRMMQLQRPNNVHFTDEGSKALGERVSTVIAGFLS